MTRQDHLIAFLTGLIIANGCGDILESIPAWSVQGVLVTVVFVLAMIYAVASLVGARSARRREERDNEQETR